MAGGFAEGLFAGRTAVVGGGGGAIGGAVARLLAAGGATVVCADLAGDRAAAVAGGIRAGGGCAVAVTADLTTAGGVAGTLVAAGGRADILVNAVGHHLDSSGPFERSTPEQWQALYEVNYLSVLRCCHTFVPGMVETGWGRVVNFSSVEGIRAAPHLAVYAGLKRAVDGFTKSLAVDLARHGVLVNAVAVDKTRAYQTHHYPVPADQAHLVPVWIPVGRYAEPDDVARIVVFLAGPLNEWLVGQTVVADGGTLSAGGWFRAAGRWTNQPPLRDVPAGGE